MSNEPLLALFPESPESDIREVSRQMDSLTRGIDRSIREKVVCRCSGYQFPHRKFSGRCIAHRIEYNNAFEAVTEAAEAREAWKRSRESDK